MENEIWGPVSGFPNYEVSNLGRVKALKFNKSNNIKLLSDNINNRGYVNVHLWNKEQDSTKPKPYRRCRLVALHFIENPKNKEFVNHINGNRNDDRVENLEWISHRENVTHSFKHNMGSQKLTGAFKKMNRGKWNGKWGSCIRVNNKLIHLGYKYSEIEAHQLYLDALVKYGLSNDYAK